MTSYSHPTLFTGDDVRINGVTLNTITVDGCRWVLTNLDGWWGLPNIDLDDDARPYSEDGSYLTHGRYTSRNVVMTGYIVPGQENPSGVPFTVAARNTFNAAMHLVRTTAMLEVDEDDETKTAAVQVVGKPLTRFSKLNDVLEFNFQLRASDPRKYALYQETATQFLPLSGNGRVYPRTHSWAYLIPGPPNDVIITNRGSYSTKPTCVISGPVLNPIVESITAGISLGFNTLVDQGDTLTVDFDDRSATRSNGLSVKNTMMVGSDWWDLTPGANDIRFSGTQVGTPRPATPARTNGVRNPQPTGSLTGFSIYSMGVGASGGSLLASSTAPSGVAIRTNLFPNPAVEATSGSTAIRTNLAGDPRGIAYQSGATLIGFQNGRWFGGGGGAGTHTLVTGATDGPLPWLTTYVRKTWTAAPSSMGNSGDTGFNISAGYTITGGQAYTISCWIRASVVRNFDITVYWQDASSNQMSRHYSPGVTGIAGQWVRVSATFVAPAGASKASFAVDSTADTSNSAVNWAIGNTLDATGILVEAIGAVGTVSRTNLIPNPVLSLNLSSWAQAFAGGTATVTREVTQTGLTGTVPYTANWIKALYTVAPTGSPIYFSACPSGTSGVPVTGSTQYTASAYLVSNYTGFTGVRIDIGWYDSSGASISTSTGTAGAYSTASQWQRVSNTATSPSNAAFAQVNIVFTGPTGMVAGTSYIGASYAMMETGGLQAYFDGTLQPTTLTVGSTYTENVWTGAYGASSSVARSAPTGVVRTYFDGSQAPALRTNLCGNPTAAASGTTGFSANYGTGGAGTLTHEVTGGFSGPDFTRMTWTTGSSFIERGLEASFTTLAFTQQQQYSVSVYVRVNAPQTLQIFTAGTAGVTILSNPAVAVPANVWTRLTASINVTAPGTFQVRVYATTGGHPWVVGNTLDADAYLVEASSTVNPYFDGGAAAPGSTLTPAWFGAANASVSNLIDGDFTCAWTGTTNASTSTLTEVGVAQVTQNSSGRLNGSSTRWSSSRSKSLRVHTYSSNDSFAALNLSGTSILATPSVRYLVTAKVTFTQALSGSLSSSRLRPWFQVNVSTGGTSGGPATMIADADPTTPGTYTVCGYFDLPSTTTSWASGIRLYHGGNMTATSEDSVWWDDIVIENITGKPLPTSAPSYFDGASALTAQGNDISTYGTWTGTADASTSIQRSTITPGATSPLGTSFARWVTSIPASGTEGWLADDTTTRAQISGVTGDSVTLSVYARYNGSSALSVTPQLSFYSAGGSNLLTVQAPTILYPGAWTQLNVIGTAPAAFSTVAWDVIVPAGSFQDYGGTLDIADAVVDKQTAFYPYFDGSYPYAVWTGTAYASTSAIPALTQVDQAMVKFTYRSAWIE